MAWNKLSAMRVIPIAAAAVAAVIMAACASMGRPQGGPRDVTPPIFVKSTPAPGELNVKRSRISIEFDENVQIKDIMSKVVISPAQTIMPTINAAGHRINVDLRDTLLPNTTYTLDFSDAISDLNESNPIDGFALAFSTGNEIDSLQISGMVLDAATLEPAQGMLVGVYSNLSDTAITTLPMERITKTNQLGQFTIRNLKEGTYNIFALNDNNRDYKWDRSEDVAFYPQPITPTATRVMHTDTLRSDDGRDSVVIHEITEFGPADILLTWFNENYTPQYLLKNERPSSSRIALQMAAPADTLPALTIVNGPKGGTSLYDVAVLDASLRRDSLDFWITDSVIIAQDSLLLEARYLRTDSLDQLSETTDTLRLFMRPKRAAKPEKKKRGEEADTLPPPTPLIVIRAEKGTQQEVYAPLLFSFNEPVESIDPAGVHLEVLDDTVWVAVEPPRFERWEKYRPMLYKAPYEWEPGEKYRLTIDTLAVTAITGLHNGPFTHEFTVKKLSDYSSVKFNITGLTDSLAIVQLLQNDNPVAWAPVVNGTAEIKFLPPGTYYARLFADSNGNGVYDVGSIADLRLPEDTYYYPKKIPLKQNWDAVLSWNVNELPLDEQKPFDIKKNKPKPKPGEVAAQRDNDDEEEEDEGYVTPGTLNDGSVTSTRRNSSGSSSRGGSRRGRL